MSKGDINIKVSGGKATFGNVALGDRNTLTHTELNSAISDGIEEFYREIDQLKDAQRIASEEVDNLKKEIERLQKEGEDRDLVGRIKALYAKYSWAIGPLKKLFSAVV